MYVHSGKTELSWIYYIENKLKELSFGQQRNDGSNVNMDCISDIADGACVMKNGETLAIKVREYGKIQNTWHKYRFDRIRSVQKV